MPGCLDACYLYWEDHSIENLDPPVQIKVEKEIEKYNRGEECDLSLFQGIIKRYCLGGYLKDSNNLPRECRHFGEMPGDLTVDDRVAILTARKSNKWKLSTLIVSIVGILTTSLFAYLNYSKPSSEALSEQVDDLRSEIVPLKKQVKKYEAEIDLKDAEVDKLKNELMRAREGARE